MAEWRELAEKDLAILMRIANGSNTAMFNRVLFVAEAKLARWIISSRLACAGVPAGVGNIPDHPFPGESPADFIELARRELEMLVADHSLAGNAFVLCRRRLGFIQGDPLWPVWEAHRADALRHAALARQWLHSAAALATAALEASDLMGSFPPQSPYWYAWSRAVLDLAVRGFLAVNKAAAETHGMTSTVAWEFLYVYKILNRREMLPRCMVQALQTYPLARR